MQGLTVFRSRFFWRLFLSFVTVLAVTGLLVDRLVGVGLEKTLVTTLETQLSEASLLMQPHASELLRESSLQEKALEEARRIGQQAKVRVTLILPDGTVLADSHEEAGFMENHGNRVEILQAREEGVGSIRRYSRTVGYSMLYLARHLTEGERDLGVLRLAVPTRDIDEQIGVARRRLALSLVAGLVVALVLGVALARRASAPIVAMTRAAAAIRDGAYDTPVPDLPRDDEVGILAGTLHDLGAEVTRRIATISKDDAQLRAMLAGMVEGVVAVDDEDHVLFCNGAARRLLDLDPDPSDRRLWEQVPIALLEELIQTARRNRSAARREIEVHRSGKELAINAHASPFQGGGRSGVVVVVQDVTGLRRLENIRRDFVANVSHELKTPLAAIKGFVETLLGGALRDEENNERFLTRIDVNVDRLTHLVTDLLSLARIEAQEGAMEQDTVDWREVVDGVLRRHQDGADRKGLQLLSTGESTKVLGDHEAMTQVVDNLVDNALKYTPEGVVEVSIETLGDQGVLRVRDTGLGIPAADLDRIFERFYRVDKARSRELGGTGLGLSIVKHLVLSMGGEVSVESQPGRGSLFTVSLPLAS